MVIFLGIGYNRVINYRILKIMTAKIIDLFPVSVSARNGSAQYHEDLDQIRKCYKLMCEMSLFTDINFFGGVTGTELENYQQFLLAISELKEFMNTQVTF